MGYATTAAQASIDERSDFIARTYAHLLGAIAAFAGLEIAIFKFTNIPIETMKILANSPYSWLVVLGVFMLGGWGAQWMAMRTTSRPMQYLGLGLYVLLEVAIFIPLLTIAVYYVNDPNLLPTAAIATFGIFGAMTGIVLYTRKDFSFMRGALMLGGFAAMGIIVVAIMFGFSLGPIFSVAMIALAAGYVLYDTSNVLHHYRTDQHVSAALALFAAIALMFYYVLRLLMSLRN